MITVILCIVKMLTPAKLNWDAGIQMEVAHRFVAGNGFTSTLFSVQNSDLTVPPEPLPLTWYPPAYSFLLMPFIILHCPMGLAVKLTSLLATLLGWLAWAKLATRLLPPHDRVSRPGVCAVLGISLLLLIFCTPSWRNTDIFQWALTPWVILLLLHSIETSGIGFTLAAGILAGLAYTFRNAALYLLPAGFISLVFISKKASPGKMSAYFLGWCLTGIPLLIYLKLHPETATASIEGYHLSWQMDEIIPRFMRIWQSWHGAAYPVLFWLPAKLRNYLASYEWYKILAGSLAIGMILWPILHYGRKLSGTEKPMQNKTGFVLALFAASLIGMLLLVTFAFTTDRDLEASVNPALNESRYYYPATTAYFILSLPLFFPGLRADSSSGARLAGISRNKIKGLVGLLLVCVFFAVGLALLFPHHPISIWMNELDNRHRRAKLEVDAISRQDPAALVFIQDYPFFIYDKSHNHGELRPIPRAPYWDKIQPTLPENIYWILQCPEDKPVISMTGRSLPIENLAEKFHLKLIRPVGEDGTTIWKSDFSPK